METEKKYKLTDEYITIGDKKLYRIEALKYFAYIKKGDKGGFVESEDNLIRKLLLLSANAEAKVLSMTCCRA